MLDENIYEIRDIEQNPAGPEIYDHGNFEFLIVADIVGEFTLEEFKTRIMRHDYFSELGINLTEFWTDHDGMLEGEYKYRCCIHMNAKTKYSKESDYPEFTQDITLFANHVLDVLTEIRFGPLPAACAEEEKIWIHDEFVEGKYKTLLEWYEDDLEDDENTCHYDLVKTCSGKYGVYWHDRDDDNLYEIPVGEAVKILVTEGIEGKSATEGRQSLARIIHGGIKTGGEHRLTC